MPVHLLVFLVLFYRFLFWPAGTWAAYAFVDLGLFTVWCETSFLLSHLRRVPPGLSAPAIGPRAAAGALLALLGVVGIGLARRSPATLLWALPALAVGAALGEISSRNQPRDGLLVALHVVYHGPGAPVLRWAVSLAALTPAFGG